MGIQEWSQDVILVNLAPEPQMSEELDTVVDMVKNRCDCSVVVNFSDADIISSSSLAKMLKLHKLVKDCNKELVFCGISARTKGLFEVVGLDSIFDVVDDTFIGLAGLQLAT